MKSIDEMFAEVVAIEKDSPKRELTGKCSMCGMCCKAIRLPASMEQIINYRETQRYINGELSKEESERLATESDIIFVYLNWEQITEEEAFIINQHLETWPTRDEAFYYRCKQFDSQLNRCKTQDKKARVCSAYPWYDRPPVASFHFYSLNCGYKVDIEGAENIE